MTPGTTKVASVMMALLIGATVAAQGPAPPAPPAPALRCDDVLSAEKAKAIMGDAFTGPAVAEPSPGFTSCDWQGPDANFGFTFANRKALAADGFSGEQRFEFDVQAMESDDRKREMLPDIGIKAATTSAGEDAFYLGVLRADGVVRMITYKVPREKMLELARALSQP